MDEQHTYPPVVSNPPGPQGGRVTRPPTPADTQPPPPLEDNPAGLQDGGGTRSSTSAAKLQSPPLENKDVGLQDGESTGLPGPAEPQPPPPTVVNNLPGAQGGERTRPPTPAESRPHLSIELIPAGLHDGPAPTPARKRRPQMPEDIAAPPKEPLRRAFKKQEDYDKAHDDYKKVIKEHKEALKNFEKELEVYKEAFKAYEKEVDKIFEFGTVEESPPKEPVVEIFDQISGFEHYLARRSASEDE